MNESLQVKRVMRGADKDTLNAGWATIKDDLQLVSGEFEDEVMPLDVWELSR